MLLNFSNHPSSNWAEKQISVAHAKYSNIIDLPFPVVNPEKDKSEVYQLALLYVQKCKDILANSSDENNAVHIMGEMTLSLKIVELLKRENINCIASTTIRKASLDNNRKFSEFEFVRFREY